MHQHAAKWTEQNKSQAIRQQTFDIKTSHIEPIIIKPLGLCLTGLIFQNYSTLGQIFTFKIGQKNLSRFSSEIHMASQLPNKQCQNTKRLTITSN